MSDALVERGRELAAVGELLDRARDGAGSPPTPGAAGWPASHRRRPMDE